MHMKIIKCIVLTSKSRSKSRNVLCSIDFCVLPKIYVCMAKRESSNYWLSSKLASWASEQFCYSTLFESTMSSKLLSREIFKDHRQQVFIIFAKFKWPEWSTCCLRLFNWLLDHEIHLKLSKFTNWTIFHSKWSKSSFWMNILSFFELLGL